MDINRAITLRVIDECEGGCVLFITFDSGLCADYNDFSNMLF